MSFDTIDRVRRVNPVPVDPPAPPIAPLLVRRDLGERRAGTDGGARRRRPAVGWRMRTRVLAGVPIMVLCALVVFALIGGSGGGQFDVAAAVYRAIAPGHGVRYVVTDQESDIDGKRTFLHVQRWSTSDPPSERSVSLERRDYGRERSVRVEAAIAPGGTWSSWWSGRPGVIEHTKAAGTQEDEVAILRAAHRAGRLRVLERRSSGAFDLPAAGHPTPDWADRP
jgi:hypothetical protein